MDRLGEQLQAMLQPTLDSQCTCVFVGLKKGVERTFNTISEVIQKLKKAVQLKFGSDAVPQGCLVSLAVERLLTIYSSARNPDQDMPVIVSELFFVQI